MHTIGIWLNGGLGNQLFMIFCALSYAIDHNLYLVIYSDEHNVCGGRPTYWDNFLDRLTQFVHPYKHSHNNYNEPGFEYIAIPKELADKNYTLHGYFQSYKYFEHNYKKIKQLLDIENKIADVKNKYADFFKEKRTIALHFRLNDYLNLPNYHPVQPVGYYLKAFEHLSADLQAINDDIREYNILYFFQAGDELIVNAHIKRCKEKYDKLNFIQVPHNIPDWEQMLLMASCDHFIMPNSTFSWFAAYLCDKPDKIVYYPALWFGAGMGDKNIKDLCPEEWKMI